MKKIIMILAAILTQAFTANAADITAEQAQKLHEEGNSIFLDIRSKEEFATGHIKGAILIEFNEKTLKNELEKLDKTKQYVIYCRSGRRSAVAETIMEKADIKNVYNVKGGIQKWQNSGYKLVK